MKFKSWTGLLFFGILINFANPAKCEVENLQQLQLIEASMNRSVDPCEDFNTYACGNWPSHKDFHRNLEEFLHYNYTIKMMEALLKKYPKSQVEGKQGDLSALEKASVYLHSCLKIKTVELGKYLEEIKPGKGLEWPLLSTNHSGNWSEFNPFSLLGQLQSYGFATNILEQTSVRRNGSILTIVTIPDAKEFDVKAVEKILRDLKIPENVISHQMEELRSTHDYWRAAYNDYADYGESENLFSYDDIKQSNPELDIFLEHVMPPTLREKDSLVLIPFWDYVEFLMSRHWNRPEENQKFCNYLMVKFLLYLKNNVNSICLETTQERMHMAYNYHYYEEFYLPQGRIINKDIVELNKLIHKSLVRIIQENRLNMTGEQLQAIRRMLAKVTLNIGNLPEYINAQELDKFYARISELDINNFYANDLKLMQHRTLEAITCPATMDCNQKLAIIPSYLPEQDLLDLPFASLHSPIYQMNMDPLFTLSSLGFLLAHEFSHNIDTSGLTYDASYGHLFENIMEQPSVKASLDCFKNQQPSATIDVNESIADFVAARTAYRSYIREYNSQPNFSQLPWRQLFFLNLGQMLCSKPLSKNGQRLNQIAMNMGAFSKAFHCPLGSKMNPENKCTFY
ncbi:phosphate-regulating neutral endopeptidase PHEX-like [Musca autumnalis]|uniref:phosphate-regulating neutral endopeptidase PHEX-like n=1 Tax=Musca autumnalis TaxID=221902 RepID=UPI003CEC4973